MENGRLMLLSRLDPYEKVRIKVSRRKVILCLVPYYNFPVVPIAVFRYN